jgi:flagella basal body P-ring formation protein FlgA
MMMRRRIVWPSLVLAAAFALVGGLSAHAAGVQLPVARITIYPGQIIEGRMLSQRGFRSSAVHPSTVQSSNLLIGKVARQTLLPNQPIDLGYVRDPYVVTQGQAALLVYQNGALRITSTGLALQSGGPGDVVSVRNVDSGRIIRGTISPDGSVNVGGP